MIEQGGGPPATEPAATPDATIPALADVADAIAKALTLDWGLLDGAALVSAAALTSAARASIDALDAAVIAALDRSGAAAARGHANTTALLRAGANRHSSDAPGRVARSRNLADMPMAAAAFATGEITAAHVRLLGECLDPRYGGRFAEFETHLVGFARDLPFRHFQRLISRWKDAADEREPDLRDRAHDRAREVHLGRSLNDRGMLSGTLTPLARAIVAGELDRITRQLWRHDWNEAVARLGERKGVTWGSGPHTGPAAP